MAVLQLRISEEAATEQLKNSIRNKSKLLPKSNTPILNSKEAKLQKIYRFSLESRGGQKAVNFSLAQKIKGLVEYEAKRIKRNSENFV